jgi:hypothetical protein
MAWYVIDNSIMWCVNQYFEADGDAAEQERIRSEAIKRLRQPYDRTIRPLQLKQATAVWGVLSASYERN